MDAITPPPPPGGPRLLLRGCALALAVGLLASCGADDDPAAAPTVVDGTSDGATPGTTSEAATTSADDTDGSADDTTDGSADDTADDSADDEAAEDVVIVISDFSYEVPDAVAPGAQITVRNEDGVGHTVTSDDETTFDVQVGPGEEVTMTAPEEAGKFPFFCRPHPAMRATLVVEEG